MKELSEPIEGIRFQEFTLEQWKNEVNEANYIQNLMIEALESGEPVYYNGMIISADYRDVLNKYNQPERTLCISIQDNMRVNFYE